MCMSVNAMQMIPFKWNRHLNASSFSGAYEMEHISVNAMQMIPFKWNRHPRKRKHSKK